MSGKRQAARAVEPEPAGVTVASETRALAALKPYPNNPRTHSDTQIEQVCRSMLEFGAWTAPCVIDEDDVVLAGHGRRLAALRLVERGHAQFAENVPVRVVRGWTEAQKRAYVIADNSIADNAGWDTNLLRLEIGELEKMDFSVDLLGFEKDFLQELFAVGRDGNADPDAVPEAPPRIARTGDIWTLGRHRLLCGSATSASDVRKLLGERKADVCLTDPPYGIGDSVSAKNNYSTYVDSASNLSTLIDEFLPIARSVAQCVVLTSGTMNHRLYPAPTWTMAWFTPAGAGRGPWGFCCWQPVLCYGKDPKTAKRKGSFPDALVHTESSPTLGHPCAKPVNFWTWLMERTSEPGELVFDPFLGSGTTIIAAERSGRTCFGIELAPEYVDIIIARWQEFTGEVATVER